MSMGAYEGAIRKAKHQGTARDDLQSTNSVIKIGYHWWRVALYISVLQCHL